MSILLDDVACGLELEYEHFPAFDMVEKMADFHLYWRTIGDGSLRNSGFELVLARPTLGRDLIKAIESLPLVPEMCLSPRGSMHIHINVNDRSITFLYLFLILSALAEKVLWTELPNIRKVVPFCRPSHKTDWYTELCRFMSQTPIPRSVDFGGLRSWYDRLCNFRELFYNRYFSINLSAIAKFGSIEFRMFPPTTSHSEIVQTVNFVLTAYAMADKVIDNKNEYTQGAEIYEVFRKNLQDSAWLFEFFEQLGGDASKWPEIRRAWKSMICKLPLGLPLVDVNEESNNIPDRDENLIVTDSNLELTPLDIVTSETLRTSLDNLLPDFMNIGE